MQSISDSSSRNALPVELTTFIGREREVAELRRLLLSTRLLTLTGGGGSGKTRLAAEVVKHAATDLAVDVAWAELAPLENPEHLAQHIGQACGIAEEIRGGDPLLLANLLSGRSLLLVLDNCEHLVDKVASVTDLLLKTCPGISVLATSREALGIKGERAWLVPALPMSDAVQLFVERARDFAGKFELTAQNRAVVEEICTRLDGIPLAIELAAARIRVLSPEQVRDRLHDAFRLLKSPARTPVPRHRTLAAAIDWSYDLLPEQERILFRRLSVFRGGFTLDAVEAVGGADALADADVLDLLARLVDRSLVVVREQNGVARYTLLETVLQYARQKLAQSTEESAARKRHAQHIERIVAEAEPHFIGPERPAWIERLVPDHENIREALNWSREAAPDLHLRLAGSLWWYWYSTRHWTEAGRILQDALALPPAAPSTRVRAKLLFAFGALGALQAKPLEARVYLDEAVAIARACSDEQLHAYAQNYLGMTYAAEGKSEGTRLCAEAAAWFAEHHDPYGHRLALLLMATVAISQGALEDAERWNLEGLAIARAFGQPRELAIALHMLASVYVAREDDARATPLLLESLTESRKDPAYFSISYTLDLLAEVVAREGDVLRAARIFGASEQLRAVIGARRFPFVEKRLANSLPQIRASANQPAFEQAWSEGRKLTAEEILDEVLAAHVAQSVLVAPAPLPQHAHARLRVCALGPLEVEIDGAPVSAELWSYGKPKELLTYLLCYPQGSSRDRIARALWPDATPSQLKNSFHVTMHHLRKALGHPEWIVVDEERYRFARDLSYEFDADVFERVARSALSAGNQSRPRDTSQLQQAVALYRGDLLDGEVAGDWIEEHLGRLHRLYLDAALALGSAWEEAGQTAAAIEIYQQLIARDNLQEEPHRRLLACWARTGERPRALKHYERLVATLQATLDAEPERETISLYKRILADQDVAYPQL
ncbi:MAG TPA: BTAD domain-containing putative transcriptional regulator [Longimicrobiales bacterium]|nr:BTAD domain-containing putative transcriptional regulator [Longimicrobiales bacterium]